ncbi:MAG: ATP-binding cassette domain-containing protein [Patescibacteria group bacterium]
MTTNETIVSFDAVTYGFEKDKPLIDGVDFSVRRGSKMTIMGQNGAGKTTILKLITRNFKPESGAINVAQNLAIGTAHQVILKEDRELTIKDFFQKCFSETMYDIGRRIDAVLEVVNLHAPHDRIIKSFSGGQQARLLLAAALIQDPDLLLLDEPTNNLDKDGIDHLTGFLLGSDKTCIVISHDADFLNAFTDGVLYLDVHTRKIEQYVGNYFDVVEQIAARIEKENMKNARLAKEALTNKEQANVFAHKGGKLRLVAKKMREKAEELEESQVDVRREDKTIRDFTIPVQEEISGDIVRITSYSVMKNHKPVSKKANICLNKHRHLLITGPNGIGKSTLLESFAGGGHGKNKGATIADGIRIGYYRQDFSTLNFDETVYESLSSVTDRHTEQEIRGVAAGFLITGGLIHRKIGSLSEGQKGLVAFARLVLQRPGLLILDEPTNHINFRHIPVIANALDAYNGPMILVSHVPEFVAQIRIDEVLDLERN